MQVIAIACAVGGCGRLGFEAVADGGGDSNGGGDGGTGPWQLVQVVGAGTGGAPKNSVSINATTANSLIVVAVEIKDVSSAVTSITDDGGNVYQPVPNAIATNTSGINQRIEMWYSPGALAGATSVTSISAPQQTDAIVAWEFANLATVDPVDTATSHSSQPASTLALAPSITTSEEGELVVAAVLVRFAAVLIHAGSGFTNDSLAHANGWGHLSDPHAPAGVYQAAWDTDQIGSYCGVAAAFRTGP